MSTSSAVRSKIASYEAITSPNGTGSNVERTRSDANLNKQQSQRQRGPTQNDTSTTTAASQSRISRIRQQQLVREGKAHNTTNLIEKRKQMKERRKMQEMRAAAKASATNRDAKIEGSRTEYIENSSTQRTNRSNNNPVSSSTEYAETAPGNSRMSKMQRMQKMKVYDHIKRGQNTTTKVKSSRVSTSSIAASSVVAGSAITAATTAVARNYPDRSSADKKKAKARRRHQQAARALKSEAMESPPASPVNKNNVALSPSGNESLGTDVFSESNYTNGATDASVDPVTDDEVTLTSVRRIVSRSNQYSPGNQSHQYQELQPSANRHTSEGHSKKSKKKSRHESRAGDSFHNPISLAAGRDGASLPSQPPGPYTRNRRNGDPRDIYRDWLDEEKSDKAGTAGGVFRTASSSDYDTDGDISKTSKASRQSNALGGPSQSQATDVNDFFTRSRYGQTSRRMDDDERTFDYGDRDDDSNGSASYATRRRKEAERRAREAAAASVAKGSNAQNEDEVEESPLINKDDVEHYTKSLDTPAMKMGAGIVGAATVGCIVLGPVGLLVGAAAVGVGVGVMQIPQQKRTNIQKNAQKALNDLHDKAIDASESISNSCGAAYKDSGVADHLPPCFPAPETVANDMESTRSEKGRGKNHEGASVKGAPKPSNLPKPQQENGPPASPVLNNDRPRNKKVACLRNGEFRYLYLQILLLDNLQHRLLILIDAISNLAQSASFLLGRSMVCNLKLSQEPG